MLLRELFSTTAIIEGSWRPFTDEDKTKIQSLYDQGVSAAEIARQLGRAQPSIVHLLNQLYPDREKRQPRPFTDEDEKVIKSLYDQGVGPVEIARQLGRSSSGYISDLLDQLYPNREKQEKRPFTGEDIKTMREMFLDGRTYNNIGQYLKRNRSSVERKIKKMKGFETVLLPNHLEKREALDRYISDEERDIVAALQAVPDMLPFQTNKWIYRKDIKRYYNIDIIIPLANGQTIAVEYFGDYYHAGPEYADDHYFKQFGITAAERRTYDKDKMDYLRSLYGKDNVVLIWGHEWLSDSKSCVARIVDAVRAASR